MYDTLLVQVRQGLNQLVDVVLNLGYGQLFPLPDQLEHIRIRTHLEKDVNIELIFKNVVELDNIFLGNTLVDSDLAQQFLLGLWLQKNGFANHLCSVLPFGLSILDQEAGSEST